MTADHTPPAEASPVAPDAPRGLPEGMSAERLRANAAALRLHGWDGGAEELEGWAAALAAGSPSAPPADEGSYWSMEQPDRVEADALRAAAAGSPSPTPPDDGRARFHVPAVGDVVRWGWREEPYVVEWCREVTAQIAHGDHKATVRLDHIEPWSAPAGVPAVVSPPSERPLVCGCTADDICDNCAIEAASPPSEAPQEGKR